MHTRLEVVLRDCQKANEQNTMWGLLTGKLWKFSFIIHLFIFVLNKFRDNEEKRFTGLEWGNCISPGKEKPEVLDKNRVKD